MNLKISNNWASLNKLEADDEICQFILSNLNLSLDADCNLTNISAVEGVFDKVNFSSCKLKKGYFKKVIFKDCDLIASDFNDCIFESVEFVNCRATGILIPDSRLANSFHQFRQS